MDVGVASEAVCLSDTVDSQVVFFFTTAIIPALRTSGKLSFFFL